MTSILKVNQINDSGDNNIITSDGSGNVTLGASFPSVGKIGQVLNTVTFTQQSTSSTGYTDITDMDLDITLSSKLFSLTISGYFAKTLIVLLLSLTIL